MKLFSNNARITFWSAVLQWSRVGTNAIVFLVLSRWLSLDEIGAVAAIQAPILIFQTLGSTTFPDFIIQEKILNNKRINSVFWLSVFVGFLLSIILFFISPIIVSAVNDSNGLLYYYSLLIIPFAWNLSSVFEGLHRRNLDIKKLAVRTLISSSVAGTAAIVLGYHGFGGWSLVIFTLINSFLSVSLTIYTSNWRPSFYFSFRYISFSRSRLLSLVGRSILASSVIPLLQFSISWQLGSASGGIFQIASRVYTLVDSFVMTPYRFVLMPIFARLKKSKHEFAQYASQAVNLGSFICSPAYLCLAIIAPALLPFMLGNTNGVVCVTAVQILSINGILASVSNVINQILTAKGFSTIVLQRSIFMYIFAVIPAMYATTLSLELSLITYSLGGGISGLFFTAFLAKKLLSIRISTLVYAWFKPFLASTFLLPLYLIYLLPSRLSDISIIAIVTLSVLPIYFIAMYLISKNDFHLFGDILFRDRKNS